MASSDAAIVILGRFRGPLAPNLGIQAHHGFLPAALAEAGLEITFKVGHKPIVGGGGSDICKLLAGEVQTFLYLAGEVVTFVNMVIDTHLVMEH